SELKQRPVFIVGHPKAGTSLLLNLLDSHSQLVVFPEETLFLRRVLPLLEKSPRGAWYGIAKANLIDFFNWNTESTVPSQAGFETHDYSFISFDAVEKAMEKDWGSVATYGDVLSAAVIAFGDAAGQLSESASRWVEKTPLHEYAANKIFELWPEAKILHIVRDPRDNFSSYERKHADWTAQHFARKWRRSTRAGLTSLRRFGPDRYLMLKYEDLVLDNQEVIERICTFLEIRFEEILNQPTKVGKAWSANTMFGVGSEQISSAPVGRWENILSNDDVTVIEVIASKQMKACGYPQKRQWGLRGLVHGGYWRLRQNYYFSLGAGRNKVRQD
ncbi:MAG: sulfotransferase, partial [Chloroflexota bacterium]